MIMSSCGTRLGGAGKEFLFRLPLPTLGLLPGTLFSSLNDSVFFSGPRHEMREFEFEVHWWESAHSTSLWVAKENTPCIEERGTRVALVTQFCRNQRIYLHRSFRQGASYVFAASSLFLMFWSYVLWRSLGSSLTVTLGFSTLKVNP